jgi:hypothetical protein
LNPLLGETEISSDGFGVWRFKPLRVERQSPVSDSIDWAVSTAIVARIRDEYSDKSWISGGQAQKIIQKYDI